MPTKNEAGRYLDLALSAARPVVDELFVFDDGSTDTTVRVAEGHGCLVASRHPTGPSFLEHEGKFRQMAWDVFEQAVEPEPGDWVLALDADEVVTAIGDPRELLLEAAQVSNGRGELARKISIPEVFAIRDGHPYVRMDGWWGKIEGSRFFAYRRDGLFADKPMASGSAPTYIEPETGGLIEGFWLLHLGYAKKEDQIAKYQRYSQRAGHGGHHVESILKEPRLAKWVGPSVPRLHHYFGRNE
jgi:glycosyltransferase involved in cell wall biosynthesis